MPFPQPGQTTYRPEYCQIVIETGIKGGSKNQMACDVGVTKTTLDNWRKAFPEFDEAMILAFQYAQQWWEKVGQEHIVEEKDGPKVNAGLYGRSMSARFPEDWREKSTTEIKNPDNETFKVENSGLVALYIPDNGRRPDLVKQDDAAE